MPAHSLFTFGAFEVDPARRRLARDGQVVPIPAKAFDVLMALIEHRGGVVEKDELLRLVWPGVVVEESNLSQHVFTLRKLLGDASSAPAYVATIPRRGYQFIAEVVEHTRTPTDRRAGPSGPAVGAVRSLAVLPFAALTPESDDHYLGFGMTDALIARLLRVPGGTVRPTSAIRRYISAPPDAADAGRALGVDLVLQGAVQKTGDWLRVTVQLITVRDRTSIWADHWEAALGDIASIEEAIAAGVAALIAPAGSLGDSLSDGRRGPADPEAHLAYLQGRFHLNLRTANGLTIAIEALERAVMKDPAFAAAHASLASGYALIGSTAYDRPDREQPALAHARTAATRALALDDTLGNAHAALAEVAFRGEWQWLEAEARFTRAIQLDPDSAIARHGFAMFLSAMGRATESRDQLRRAESLDEVSVRFTQMGFGPAAIPLADAQRTCDLSGRRPYALAVLGFAFGRDGQTEEARQLLAELTDLHDHGKAPAWLLAYPCAGMGDIDGAFEWLSRGADERGALPAFINVEPVLAALRNDRRFGALVQRLRLPG